MTLFRDSQAGANVQSLPVSQADRPSAAPTLKLVTPARISTLGLPLAGLKGPAPGRYHEGAALLSPGARVGILCDTLYADRELGLDYRAALHTAAELIAELGFEPVVDRTHAAVAPYFERWAGSVEQRAAHFVRLLDDYQVDAVFPLFGKGGCHAVVDMLAASGYRPRRPVVLIGGFSQHTDLSLFAQSRRGRGFFSHVLNATQCAYWKHLPRANVDNLGAILRGAESVQYEGIEPLNARSERAARPITGILSGGNLGAMLLNKDKPWMPSLLGRIVLCEDYDRHAHDFHRTFSAFARLAEESSAAAILVSAMLPMKRPAHAVLSAEERKAAVDQDRAEIASIVREVAARTRVPMFSHAGIAGHGAMNYPLGMGGLSRLVPQLDGSFALFNQLAVRS